MLLDVKSWCWMAMSFLFGLPAGGIVTFGPFIIRGFGFNGLVSRVQSFHTIRLNLLCSDTVMLLLIPFGVFQIMFLVFGFVRASDFIHLGLIISLLHRYFSGQTRSSARSGRFWSLRLLHVWLLLVCFTDLIALPAVPYSPLHRPTL